MCSAFEVALFGAFFVENAFVVKDFVVVSNAILLILVHSKVIVYEQLGLI
jgi:hypothetical protein